LDDYKSYDEIDSGTAYHLFQQKIAEKKDAVQIPLIFFSDGTVVDKTGRHSFEPFMFTLGIFKQALRTNLWLGEILVSLEVTPRLNSVMLTRRQASKMFISMVRRIQDMFQIIIEIFMHK